MAETLSLISVIAYIAAGVFFVASVIMGIAFRIPELIGDLTGRNARKSVENIRRRNEQMKTQASAGKKHGEKKQPASRRQSSEKEPAGKGRTSSAQAQAQEEIAVWDSVTGQLFSDTEELRMAQEPVREVDSRLHMIEEVMLIHTDERLELS